MEILYEDSDIIVVEKPAGIPTQTADIRQRDIVDEIKAYFKKSLSSKGEPYVGIVHRLDQPVGGILVFAKNEPAAAGLSKQITQNIFKKSYLAKVEGLFSGDSTVKSDKAQYISLTDYLKKDSKQNKALIAAPSDKGAKRAELLYRILSEDEEKNTTLLEIQLVTGRFHQIRAQLSHMGHPITGDAKYGAGEKKSSIGLCAYKLEFRHPKSGKSMSFELNKAEEYGIVSGLSRT